MKAYYNECDPYCADWLRNLIAAGLIMPGDVDTRSIVDVRPADVAGYERCHWFAGIGVWDYALGLAGWPAGRPVWTGSCPCQPFSSAGRRAGFDDERHLWPVWFDLIRECKPAIVFGEQVASPEVVGRGSDINADMQTLRDREAVYRVLRQLEGTSPRHLHNLCEGAGKVSEEARSRSYESLVQSLEGGEPRARAGYGGEASREVERAALRSGRGSYPSEDRRWFLRDDGHSVRSQRASILERALAGSDQAWRGVYFREHTRGSLFSERDGEHLGSEPHRGDSGGDQGTAENEERCPAREADRFLEEAHYRGWLDAVFADLEGQDYACGAVVLGAHSVGAPHIRQRLWFVADAKCFERGSWRIQRPGRHGTANGELATAAQFTGDGRASGVGDTERVGLRGEGRGPDAGAPGGMPHQDGQRERLWADAGSASGSSPWSELEWLACRDGKSRPTQPGLQPLVDGATFKLGSGSAFEGRSRVGMLKGAGNAINAETAAAFVAAARDTLAPQVTP